MYKRVDVEKVALEYFKDPMVANVWMDKYALKSGEGEFVELSPDDTIVRMAKELSRIEQKYKNPISYEVIYNLMKGFNKFVLGGSPLFGIGNDYTLSTLGNCFSGDTEIITNLGIKQIGELANSTPQIFSSCGKWISSKIKSFGEQQIVHLVVKRGKTIKTIDTTKEHLWFAKLKCSNLFKQLKTIDLKKGLMLQDNYTRNFQIYKPSPFGVAHGFYTGDGDKSGNDRISKRIKLCNPDIELLPYFTPQLYSQDSIGINLNGIPNSFRELPPLTENVSYLYGWLAGYFAADGCIDTRGSIIISSVDINKLIHVKNVCSVLGLGTYGINSQTRISNLTNRESTIYNIRLISSLLTESFFIKENQRKRFLVSNKTLRWFVKDIIITNDYKEVFCAIVPKESSFTLEGNILTHNCFVVDSPVDSYGGIFKTDQELAQLMKRRGGVGVDISTLRPRGSTVHNAASSSTGSVSFMERFSNTTREVAQEGRRGALMISMDVEHPDILEFITAKDDLTKITGANISVRVSDSFMNSSNEHSKDVWSKVIHQAWKNAEPGILFWDRIIENSPADCYPGFKTISTNPCSELPLCAYDSCRLSAINLYAYVKNPFTKEARFDFDELSKDVRVYQRLMDDLIDLEEEKIIKIRNKITNDKESEDIKSVESRLWYQIHNKLMMGRRTGLGQMGLADAGAALNLRYGEENFIKLAEQTSKLIAIYSYIESINMAKERGAFPTFNLHKEIANVYLKRISDTLGDEGVAWYHEYGRRNIANLTIAPTGSISMLAGVSSGIEPVFALSYTRKRKVSADNPNKKFQDKQGDWWEEYTIIHPKIYDYGIANGYNMNLENPGLLKQIVAVESPYYKSTAHEVDPYSKLKVQAVIQPWIDHSISVTYNLPSETTEEQVSNIYKEAWKLGLKGMTVYRDGSRDGIMTTKKFIKFDKYDAPKRPKELICDVHNIMAKGRPWKVLIGLLDETPYEVFAVNGTIERIPIDRGILRKVARGRYDLVSMAGDTVVEDITHNMTQDEEAFTRTISWALRHGAKLEFGIEQLNKSQGDITSFAKAIARTLKKYCKDGEVRGMVCSECGTIMVSEGGCWVCKQCGVNRCE